MNVENKPMEMGMNQAVHVEFGPREPAVAGSFYLAHGEKLRRQLRVWLASDQQTIPAIAVMSPHAGYVYSGATAASVFRRIQVPEHVMVLGPNHTGAGPDVSVRSSGEWITPVGDAPCDEALCRAILREAPMARADQLAHRREHSIEVQLPFLLERNPRVRIAPVILGRLDEPRIRELGVALARAIRSMGEPVLMVISSDMNHYEKADTALRKDDLALERFLALDPAGLLEVTQREQISMCGVIPAAVALHAALSLGASQAELINHTHSGMVNGDLSHVVGYAAARVW
ncbi:MAG: hypothetical protein GMKNLPBB_00849 [Myxococcota bacterium]|nr:hypothetical protein [Myxococcota bacterium]